MPVNLGRDQPIPRPGGEAIRATGLGCGPWRRERRPRRPSAMNDVTRILSAIEHGDPQAAEQLLPLVYDELRKLAAQRLAQEKPGQTLQATALVHEAYLRLVDVEQGPALEQPGPLLRRGGRGHAPHPGRQRPAQARPKARRAGSRPRVDLDELAIARAGPTTCSPWTRPSITSRGEDPPDGRLVKLRFFAGLTHQAGGRGPRHLAADGRPLLGLRQRLALRARIEARQPALRDEPCPRLFEISLGEPARFLALAVRGALSATEEVA